MSVPRAPGAPREPGAVAHLIKLRGIWDRPHLNPLQPRASLALAVAQGEDFNFALF
jgi:hypothetical protein